MKSYIKPERHKKSFTCPHCNAISLQSWVNKNLIVSGNYQGVKQYDLSDSKKLVGYIPGGNYKTSNSDQEILNTIDISICTNCTKSTIWIDGKLLFPNALQVPDANTNMPEKVRQVYYEAAEVFNISVKSSGALLRLAIQYLCKELGYDCDINEAIKKMVAKGLDERVQKSLDIIRVIGNNAVHPGEINLDEEKETVMSLFNLLNFIVEEMISKENEINKIFAALPQKNLEAINKRDNFTNK